MGVELGLIYPIIASFLVKDFSSKFPPDSMQAGLQNTFTVTVSPWGELFCVCREVSQYCYGYTPA